MHEFLRRTQGSVADGFLNSPVGSAYDLCRFVSFLRVMRSAQDERFGLFFFTSDDAAFLCECQSRADDDFSAGVTNSFEVHGCLCVMSWVENITKASTHLTQA